MYPSNYPDGMNAYDLYYTGERPHPITGRWIGEEDEEEDDEADESEDSNPTAKGNKADH